MTLSATPAPIGLQDRGQSLLPGAPVDIGAVILGRNKRLHGGSSAVPGCSGDSEGNGLFGCSSRSQSITEGNRGRNEQGKVLRAGAEVETKEEPSPGLPALGAQLRLMYSPGPPAQGRHCPQWLGPPPPTSSEDNTPRAAHRPSDGRDFPGEFPPS